MITCQLQGGLGNQMFKIASTMGHAIKYGMEYGFDLNHCHTPQQGKTANKYKDNFYKKVKTIESIHSIPNIKFYRENTFSYQELPKEDNICLVGYFQSEKYFFNIKDTIKNLFEHQESITKEVETYLNSFDGNTCVIQVRRGDYLKLSNYHMVCDKSFYEKAMNIIGSDTHFIFVSDDIEWCKKNFIGDNISYSPFVDEITDLCLISNCDNKIISNSSFGWWGSWLSKKKGVTICPNKWFNYEGPKDFEDVYIDSWMRI